MYNAYVELGYPLPPVDGVAELDIRMFGCKMYGVLSLLHFQGSHPVAGGSKKRRSESLVWVVRLSVRRLYFFVPPFIC